ncbi:unnamed protein product [Ectocarpus sp. CCAP 1310/34]|nr:unnamed protein product [Ectocarpus sp. CCAP 1310/34]
MPSACSGSAAPVPLLRCRCSGAAVARPSTTKLDPLRFVHALVAVLPSRFLAFSLPRCTWGSWSENSRAEGSAQEMFVRAPRFDAVRMLRFRCSGATAPVPLLGCRCG